MIDFTVLRKDFPILSRRVNGKELVYLDSAASSQKPNVVIESVKSFYENKYSNIHRGLYDLSQQASQDYEESRTYIAKFFNAKSEELIFTKNATESMNLIAYSMLSQLKSGDEVIISEMEHHANIVPWHLISKLKKIKIKSIPFNHETGLIDVETLKKNLTKNTKIVSLTHASNVLGSINPIKELSKTVKKYNPDIIFGSDLAQSAPHLKIDFKSLGIDFGVFSSHKMLGPSGVGGLLAKTEFMNSLSPFMGGGDMIKSVSYKQATYQKTPYKFEAGTPNIEGVIGLKAAIVYLNRIGMKNVRIHELELLKTLMNQIKDLDYLEYYGPKKIKDRTGLFAFNLVGIHAHDVSEILNQHGIATRSGHHCAQPLHQHLGLDATTRASFYLYNTKQEVNKLVEGIKKTKEVFI